MKPSRLLLIVAFALLTAGLTLYRLGSQINLGLQSADSTLWEQAPGDKWLYIGGVMMLISGSFSLAALRIWWRDRRN